MKMELLQTSDAGQIARAVAYLEAEGYMATTRNEGAEIVVSIEINEEEQDTGRVLSEHIRFSPTIRTQRVYNEVYCHPHYTVAVEKALVDLRMQHPEWDLDLSIGRGKLDTSSRRGLVAWAFWQRSSNHEERVHGPVPAAQNKNTRSSFWLVPFTEPVGYDRAGSVHNFFALFCGIIPTGRIYYRSTVFMAIPRVQKSNISKGPLTEGTTPPTYVMVDIARFTLELIGADSRKHLVITSLPYCWHITATDQEWALVVMLSHNQAGVTYWSLQLAQCDGDLNTGASGGGPWREVAVELTKQINELLDQFLRVR